MPLSSYLYKSDAVSALASAVSDISDSLSDYVLCSDLSARVNTNYLSAGAAQIDSCTLSVETVGGYNILKIGETSAYNITTGKVVQSALPRMEVDASTTVFCPVEDRFFKLVALVDDKSMDDPSYIVNFNLDVVEISQDDIDPDNDELCEGVYLRVPGKKEQFHVLSVGVEIDGETGEPEVDTLPVDDEVDVRLGCVTDRIIFSGSSIRTNGRFSPTRVTLTVNNSDDENPWLIADSEYAQAVVESELDVVASGIRSSMDELQKQISTNTRKFNKIKAGLSSITYLEPNTDIEDIRIRVNEIVSLLSAAVCSDD